jgi:hypothetical protein
VNKGGTAARANALTPLIATRRYELRAGLLSVQECPACQEAVMSAAGIVLVCALDLLGRSPDRLPPIQILTERPPQASVNAEAFADSRTGTIYLIASAPSFRAAQAAQSSAAECRDADSLKMVASIIVHEEWHLAHGADEEGAYYAQLMALQVLGLGPGSISHACVKRAMQAVLAARRVIGRDPVIVTGVSRHLP